MRILDLFSGIGGFSLAAHAVGFDTVAFCEIEPYAASILRRHFPGVPVFDDVKELTADALADAERRTTERRGGHRELDRAEHEAGERLRDAARSSREGRYEGDGVHEPLILTGGFPCQDISYAGKGAGLAGERSGLFYEVARLVGELRPDYVLLENVAALLTRGLDAVLGTLASLGYDTLWACVPACAVGAPHRRDRVWIVAVPQGDNEARLRGMYEHVLSRLAPFGDLSDGWPTAARGDTWSTPRSEGFDAGGGRKHSSLMQEATWSTPSASDCDRGPDYAKAKRPGAGGDDLTTQTCRQQGQSGSLNPDWVDALMGYPVGYTLPEGEPLVTLPGVWPVGHAEDGEWPTPRAGNPGSRAPGTGGKVIAEEARKAQHWPAGLGAPQHEWEPPRLTTDKQHRASRLKTLGNSIVPQVALLWMEAIRGDAPATCEGVQACDDVRLREQVAR